MASEKQIEANRRNAQKSTGPKTPQGKAAVRLNALRHGLRARTVVLPDEKPDDFHQLCADLEAEFQPQTRAEQILVEEMAVSHWKLARLEIGEKSIFTQKIAAKEQIGLIVQLSMYEARLKRAFTKAMRELEHLQKNRRPEPLPEPAPQLLEPVPVSPPRIVPQVSYVMAPEPVAPAPAPLPNLDLRPSADPGPHALRE